jgi:FAD-linked oxidoreductase
MLLGGGPMSSAPWIQNWSGALRFQPQAIVYPRSETEIAACVQQAAQAGHKLRLIGAGHSFSPLIHTPDVLMSLDHFQGILRFDIATGEVEVKAGTRLYQLSQALAKLGRALENLGDIDRQSIAGAISTGTHGTGLGFGGLATQVTGLWLITANGETHFCSATENPELFAAARVSLGTLGVISRVRVRTVPRFRLELQQHKESVTDVLAKLPQTLAENRHFEFFYFPHTDVAQTKYSNPTEAEPTTGWKDLLHDLVMENLAFKGLSEISRRVPGAPIPVAKTCGAALSSRTKISDSYRVFAVPRLVKFNEMEYCLPLDAFPEAFQELKKLIATQRLAVHFPIECRFGRGDDIWLSPAYGRDSAYIAVHQYQGMPYHDYFRQAEQIFRAHGGRPHWGKMHDLRAADFAGLYPHWDAFGGMRARLDPQGVFLSPYLQRLLEPVTEGSERGALAGA